MNIVLLTHERELTRPTNTGQLALAHFPQYCKQLVWSRINPDKGLQQACQTGEALLLFPAIDKPAISNVDSDLALISADDIAQGDAKTGTQKSIIILDATWQEARKMVRQSPYLQQANRLELQATQDSTYQLRRNQVQGGLCTLECVQLLFSQAGLFAQAAQLGDAFAEFNRRGQSINPID